MLDMGPRKMRPKDIRGLRITASVAPENTLSARVARGLHLDLSMLVGLTKREPALCRQYPRGCAMRA